MWKLNVGNELRFTKESGRYFTNGKIYEIVGAGRASIDLIDDEGDDHEWGLDSIGDYFELVDGNIEYGGVEYHRVKRKAEVGELVYVISCAESPELDFKIGKCTHNHRFDDGSIDVDISTSVYGNFGFLDGDCDEYFVLEPVESEGKPVESTQDVIDLLANISRRLYEAERQLKSQAYEINELYKASADGTVADRD